jgi:hypothetical protein
MKKLLAVALVAVSMLSLAAGHAFALPMRHCWCCNRCCHISCSQYNAFSPWCCNGPFVASGPGPSGFYPPVCASYGGNGYGSQLPVVSNGGPVQSYAATGVAPGYNSVPAYTNGMPAQTYTAQSVPPGFNQMPSYPTNMVRPNSYPSYYPGSMGYAPAYGAGR